MWTSDILEQHPLVVLVSLLVLWTNQNNIKYDKINMLILFSLLIVSHLETGTGLLVVISVN